MRKRLIHPIISAHYRMIAERARPKIAGTEKARERARKGGLARWRKYHEEREREKEEKNENARSLGMDGQRSSENVQERDIQEERERLINELFFGS